MNNLPIIHKAEAQRMLFPKKGEIIKELHCWIKDGSVMVLKDVVCIDYNEKAGTRKMKSTINPSVIREIRDTCIFRINDYEVSI